ncbi:ArnT family glycosyltransferase [Aureliella helgolandensis]|uniref:Undecaprenyl phosphate-alpha-4-amino-4-deoxy-L-arabinose arabinosyl transferase n=1 Tax=Aureliella helgolandensis TaxID=2527968 RepID=A0A518GDB7_9BACT|nr:glycosyltransferase family 39 protein [Aureliella helgolandensis]QDV26583.1 Undecaprenyl phosphate-alpha-4-amino-4-deoxy-L-arabinose arabinosyl transferase [Aureliella helgolandensis]
MSHVSFRRMSLLALVVCSVFFVELGGARLWDRDEPRNSRASHEMLERGDWIVPTFNGELRTHKPVLLYWGQMLSYLSLGESEFTARFPSALCALLTVFTIAVLGSRLSGRSTGISQEGFWAAGALATCLFFVMAGRAATPDSCLIAFSTLGIAFLVIGSLAPSAPYSSGRVVPTRWLPAIAGYAMLGLAVLAKGPVGFILPMAVVHAWWLACRRCEVRDREVSGLDVMSLNRPNWVHFLIHSVSEAWHAFRPWKCLQAIWALKAIPGFLIMLLVAAPWYYAVGVETNGAFLQGFFLEHNVGRAVSSMEGHNGFLLFYPLAFLVGTFPWSLWFIPILLWCRKASREGVVPRQMIILSAAWVSVYIVAFSIASTKLPSYITPCYAGAALVIGGYWRQFESGWALPSRSLRLLAYSLTIVLGVGIFGVILVLSSHESMPLLARASVCGAVLASVGILGLLWEYKQQTNRVPAAWLMGAAAFQVILFGYGAKSIDTYRTDLRMLAEVNADQPTEHWLSIGGMEPSWVHYLGHEIVEVNGNELQPETWHRVARFLEEHSDGKVIVVGERANRIVANHRSGEMMLMPLTELATTQRFMKSGAVSIYGLQESDGSHVVTHAEPESSPSDRNPAIAALQAIPAADDEPIVLLRKESQELTAKLDDGLQAVDVLPAALPPAADPVSLSPTSAVTELAAQSGKQSEAEDEKSEEKRLELDNGEVSELRGQRTADRSGFPNPLRPK